MIKVCWLIDISMQHATGTKIFPLMATVTNLQHPLTITIRPDQGIVGMKSRACSFWRCQCLMRLRITIQRHHIANQLRRCRFRLFMKAKPSKLNIRHRFQLLLIILRIALWMSESVIYFQVFRLMQISRGCLQRLQFASK